MFLEALSKGPFRTKNTTTIVKIVNYYAVVFLLRRPYLLRRGPFFERKNVCNSQENGVGTGCAAIVNYSAIVNSLRVVNLLRVVFLVRRGPLGCEDSLFFLKRFSLLFWHSATTTAVCQQVRAPSGSKMRYGGSTAKRYNRIAPKLSQDNVSI